jgi:lysophospholipase L1-like esterase
MIVEGSTLPSGYLPYGPSLRIAGQNVALDATNSNLPLFGKLGVLGDSLSNQEKWQTTACAVANITEWHKNAITGSCVASYPDATKVPFVERYLETPEDCDCITIMGGTNDANDEHGGGQNMGEVGVLSNGTFKGAYSTIIEGLLARKPSVRILLITPPRSYTKDNVLNEKIKLYADATKEIAEYYGLPCLDLYNNLGINDKTFTYMLYDNVHLSEEGGWRVGRMIGNFIRQNY